MKRRLNYANVMATIAVFLALGGGAYAAAKLKKNSVKSSTIQNGQVKSADIQDGGVNSVDLNAAALAGKTVSGYEVVTGSAPYNSTDIKTATPSCPAGKVLLGGGAVVTKDSAGTPVALTASGPNPLGSSTGWYASAQETTATGDSWNLQVTIYCADFG